MFESSHNYVFVHDDVPNAISFEKISKSDITSENMILEIILEFLKIEQELNQKNFYSTDLNTENYLITPSKKFPKQNLTLNLISAENVQIFPSHEIQMSELNDSMNRTNSFTSPQVKSAQITKFFLERLVEIAFVLYQEFYGEGRISPNSLSNYTG